MPLCWDERRQEAAVHIVGDKITSRLIQLRMCRKMRRKVSPWGEWP